MASGKFSKPRNHFSEEPVVRRAYDTQPTPVPPEPVPEAFEEHLTEETIPQELLQEDLAIEQAFREVSDPEDDYEPSLPPFLESILNFIGANRKVVLVCSCVVALALLVAIIAVIWVGTASDPYDGKILNNVTIAGVNVGGMTKSQAEDAVKAVTKSTFTEQDMVVQLPDTTLYLSPADTGAQLDVKAAVKAAYAYGRTGTEAEQREAYNNSFTGNHTIGLLPYLGLDEAYIWSVLEEYASQFGSTYTETIWEVLGEMPALEAESFDAAVPCQTLAVTIGTPGLSLDMETVYNNILDAYSFNTFLVSVDVPSAESTPEPLDLEAIYQELYIAPVNATVDMQTYEPVPGVYGYGFDMEAAQKLLDKADYGETVEIPMEYIEPDIMDDDVLFRDVLGECQTPYSYNVNRTINLQLACQALNGVVLMPGETLSYNETVGERTTEKGYKPAPAYSGTNLVDSVGGGVCQVSSTLYYCALLSDMEIVSRVNHGFKSSYIDPGMDATVSWNGPDFQFRNNWNYPIMIEAEASDGYVKMRILGTDEKDYYVKMEYEIVGYNMPDTEYVEYAPNSGYYDGQVISGGSQGPIVKTYRCKYSKETNELISRDFETRSSYMASDMVVVKIVGGTTETTPTVPETGGGSDSSGGDSGSSGGDSGSSGGDSGSSGGDSGSSGGNSGSSGGDSGSSGGDSGSSGGDSGSSGGDSGSSGGDSGSSGGDPGASSGDSGSSGGDSGSSGADPGSSGADPGASSGDSGGEG